MRIRKLITKAVLAVCGVVVFLGGPQKAADANYYHLIECELEAGAKLDMDTSQKEAAKRAIFFREVGSFDDGGEAILGAFCHYYQPKFLTELSTIDEEDAKKITKWLNDLGPDGLKERAKQRADYGGLNATYFGPYNSSSQMGGDKPYYYLVTADEPVVYTDKDGRPRIDADKTKFFARYKEWVPFAYLVATAYEAGGKTPSWSTSLSQEKMLPGFALYRLMLNHNNSIYHLRKANGEEVVPRSVFNLANRYWELRKGTDAPADQVVQNMKKRGEWDTRTIGSFYNRAGPLLRYIYDNPVSK